MRHKVKHVHFVGSGGTDASREQGPPWGCDRPRAASTAVDFALTEREPQA